MKWLIKTNSRETSVTMFLMAMLLVSSMTFREYAHFIDHAHGSPGTAETSYDHDAKFHYLTEALLTIEPPCWHDKLVMVIPPLSEKNPFAAPRFLPDTRAPPVSV